MATDKTLTPKDTRLLVERIADSYFIDEREMPVGSKTIEHANIVFSLFSWLGKKNVLYVGSPGTGKTTLACLISSLCSGLPFDLFEQLKIQGHVDHTKDTLLMRPFLGGLATEEVTVQSSIYLPAFILDEINRLTPGKQAVVLEYLRTGVAEHLGKVYACGETPSFCTMNYNGPGTYPLIPGALDRFPISLELPKGSSFARQHIRNAAARIKSDLCNPDLTQKLRNMLVSRKYSDSDKINMLKEEGAKAAGNKVGEKAKEALYFHAAAFDPSSISIPYDPIATTFQRCIWDECNSTPLYGDNRECDPRDTSSHNICKNASGKGAQPTYFANSYLAGGFTQRGDDAITFYATMLAWYLGDMSVTCDHVMAVAPLCLAHRVQCTEDFKDRYKEIKRVGGLREEEDAMLLFVV